MKIASQDNPDIVKISRVTSMCVDVGEVQITQPFFLGVNHPVNSWITAMEKITVDAIERLPLEQYELLLLGTGSKYTVLKNDCMGFLSNTIPFEVMTTVSACRTFNIVAGEGRKVLLAALIGSENKTQE
ncbi:MAG: hypothetical protein ISR05_01920 [Burkholderiales bacterium]|nr:hypothetical protein [Burkholderiales bacterium]MBL6878715.1 hypothetical protein [Burkholderiales bacterium]